MSRTIDILTTILQFRQYLVPRNSAVSGFPVCLYSGAYMRRNGSEMIPLIYRHQNLDKFGSLKLSDPATCLVFQVSKAQYVLKVILICRSSAGSENVKPFFRASDVLDFISCSLMKETEQDIKVKRQARLTLVSAPFLCRSSSFDALIPPPVRRCYRPWTLFHAAGVALEVNGCKYA